MAMLISTLIPFLEDNKVSIKLHFARGSKIREEALMEFLAGRFKEWQEYQNNRNFGREYILSLISLGNMEWLFGGVYSVKGCKETKDGHFIYDTELTDIGEDLIGKAIIYYKRQFRQSYCCLERYIDDLEVIEIRRESYKLPFPGYDKVSITWKELYSVIDTDAWKTALQNQKGVYLITDTSNGKQYVGSATGDGMLWGRWKSYIDNGHGGNKDLKKLKFSYIQENFQYSILDVYKENTADDIILEREKWWKYVLKSREFGYNRN